MPRSLLALLGVVSLLGLGWALVVPPFQSPDEASHYAYVESLAERRQLPGDPVNHTFSTAQRLYYEWTNADQTAGIEDTNPEWSAVAEERYRRVRRDLPPGSARDGGGPNAADAYPPLYYGLAAIATAATPGPAGRLYLARFVSVFLLLVTVTGAWLLAGELFGRQRDLQLAAAGLTGLVPMMTFVSASVNPDALLFAGWSLSLWLAAKTAKGVDPRVALGLGIAVSVAVLAKPVGLVLVPVLVTSLVLGVVRAPEAGRTLAGVAAAVGSLLLLVGGWAVVAAVVDHRGPGITQLQELVGTGDGGAESEAAEDPPAPPDHQEPDDVSESGPDDDAAAAPADGPPERPFLVRELASYVWQFYLPRLPWLTRVDVHPHLDGLPVYAIWVQGGWGRFGWLEVGLPSPTYPILAAITVVLALLSVTLLIRWRRRVDWGVVGMLGLAGALLLGGLHVTEYVQWIEQRGAFNQGRYLLPMLPAAALCASLCLRAIPAGGRRLLVLGAGLGLLYLLQLVSLLRVVERFYA